MSAEPVSVAWPAPANVRTVVTTRCGGVSTGRYASFNLAMHCGDDVVCVSENRARLTARCGAPGVCWLDQKHATNVVDARIDYRAPPQADASWCQNTGRACAILSADCLPVLICDRAGSLVAAAHCGWRGLAEGILPALLNRLAVPADDLLVWLGPAIGPQHYQIGSEVHEALRRTIPAVAAGIALTPSDVANRWQADLYAIARAQLNALGVTAIYGGGFCTYRESRFYSYRRDGETGRMASLIWLAES